jgi:hypothetical protein
MMLGDVQARADLFINRWILLVSLRYSAGLSGEMPDEDDYDEVALGLGAGRQFSIGRSTLDLTLSPSVVSMSIVDDDGPGPTIEASRTQLRLGAAARWTVPIGGAWRFTLTADTEISPHGLRHASHFEPGDPALPAWTGALRAGAAGSLL